MITVNLQNNWFGPDGDLYRASRNPHRFSDDWRNLLPKSAKVSEVDDDEDEAPKPKGK